MSPFPHNYHFDPSYGYNLERLLHLLPPEEPPDFATFWLTRYHRVLGYRTEPSLWMEDQRHPRFETHYFGYRSTDGVHISGWLLIPRVGNARRVVVVGHGYGGWAAPDFDLPVRDSMFAFPCFRGLSRSRCAPYSDNPSWHVLHDIDKRDRYVLGGCVEDLWLAISALLELFPHLVGHIGYMGISFGGGIGALGFPWDERIRRVHLNVPTFGHQPIRINLPTLGSGEAVRGFQRRHGNVLDTLRYYDAALGAKYSRIPVHVAAALFDPYVAPPGQFAIYNALPEPKRLFVLEAGHFEYPRGMEQKRQLLSELEDFFETL